MKRALCLQHVAFEGPGVYRDVLTRHDYAVECILVPRDGVPNVTPDFLLVMGGPMSANDEEPWVQAEIHYIRRCLQAGVPYLGICLGGQLLARAIHGTVYPGPVFEAGMSQVEKTDAARNEVVLAGFPDQLQVFQWHGEGVKVPDAATVLMTSERFPVQAFRYGQAAYGFVFHLEPDLHGVRTLCRECPEDVLRAGRTADAIIDEARPAVAALHAWAERLLEAMLPA